MTTNAAMSLSYRPVRGLKTSDKRSAAAATAGASASEDGIIAALLVDMLDRFQAFQIAKEFYKSCKSLRLPYYLKDQLLRSSSSIALNLSEGKRTHPDQRRFYVNAYGSLRESQAILELEDIKDPHIRKLADNLGAILYTLSRKKPNSSDADAAAVAETD